MRVCVIAYVTVDKADAEMIENVIRDACGEFAHYVGFTRESVDDDDYDA